jgi:hypothetical protein
LPTDKPLFKDHYRRTMPRYSAGGQGHAPAPAGSFDIEGIANSVFCKKYFTPILNNYQQGHRTAQSRRLREQIAKLPKLYDAAHIITRTLSFEVDRVS